MTAKFATICVTALLLSACNRTAQQEPVIAPEVSAEQALPEQPDVPLGEVGGTARETADGTKRNFRDCTAIQQAKLTPEQRADPKTSAEANYACLEEGI